MPEIKTIAVLGAGTMGNGIAHVCARAGFNVLLCDIQQAFLDRGLSTIEKNLAREVAKDKLTQDQATQARARIVLTLGTDELLHIAGVFPPWGQSMVGFDGTLLLATAYRVVYGVAGSYLIARLAPSQRMLHALVGGVFGVIVSAVGAVATWNSGPAFGPHWYPLALIVTALPSAWVGGKLRLMQLRSPATVNAGPAL